MDLEEMGKRLRCPRCGKKMEKIESQLATRRDMFPMGTVFSSIPDVEYLSTLRHYQCPKKHVSIVLMRAVELDDAKFTEMKCRRYSSE